MYEVSWHIENRVILCKISESVSVVDIKAANAKLREYVAQGTNPLHCILDISELKTFPIDINLFRSDYPFHGMEGWIVLIGGNALMRYSAGVVAKFVGTDFHTVENFDAAVQFIQQEDSSILI